MSVVCDWRNLLTPLKALTKPWSHFFYELELIHYIHLWQFLSNEAYSIFETLRAEVSIGLSGGSGSMFCVCSVHVFTCVCIRVCVVGHVCRPTVDSGCLTQFLFSSPRVLMNPELIVPASLG